MEAVLVNLSPMPRQTWATVTFPHDLPGIQPSGEATFQTADGRRFRAVRGRVTRGKAVFRIHAKMTGGELVQGMLLPQEHPDKCPFLPHPWSLDYPYSLLPMVGAMRGGELLWSDKAIEGLLMLEQDAAHQRWWIRRRIPQFGLILEWWIDLLSCDAVAPVWGKVIWSDRKDKRDSVLFDAIALQLGEYISFDFATRNGIIPSFQGSSGNWITYLSKGPLVFSDGSGLPISGSMLAIAQGKMKQYAAGDPEDMSNWQTATMANLAAALHGPIVGVSTEWDGHWLAHWHTPRFAPGYKSDFAQAWERFQAMLRAPAGWLAERPLGVTATPGQTGDQEDFGATKGTYAVTDFDPRFIRMLQYSVQAELFRGFNHYEENGHPLDLAKHPDWCTWSGVTHYHPGVSRDRLGKSEWGQPPATGWFGMDDQHRSQNNLAAYLALTDDPLMADQMRHLATTDAACYRFKFPQYGPGAARAQGRVSGAWAHLATVLDDHMGKTYLEMLKRRMSMTEGVPSLQVPGPMKALCVNGPDERKRVVDDDNNLAPTVSIWEHALAVVGIYAAAKMGTTTILSTGALYAICEMIATFGFFEGVAGWWTVDDIQWKEGNSPTGGLYEGSPHLVAFRGVQGVAGWTVAGLRIAAEVLGPNHYMAEELSRYLEAVGAVGEARDLRTAEWWAGTEGPLVGGPVGPVGPAAPNGAAHPGP